MNVDRALGSPTITIRCETIREADAIEHFLQHKIAVDHGDLTAANAEKAEWRSLAERLTEQRDAITVRQQENTATADEIAYAAELNSRIADINATIRAIEWNAAAPEIRCV